jgi:hypothetical protein
MTHACTRILAALAFALAASSAIAVEITLYENPDFGGRRIVLRGTAANFDRGSFNDRAMSISIRSGYWELCTDAYFQGDCVRMGPGEYRKLPPSLSSRISSVRLVGAAPPPPPPLPPPPVVGGVSRASITLFERRDFGGQSITLTANVTSLERVGFNDRADAAIVRGGVWRLCEHARQQGNCRTFPPGRYNDLGSLGGKVSSVAIVPR